MDTPIAREVEQRLPRPLHPRRRGRKSQVELDEFDPYPPHGNQIITNYQNELLDLFKHRIEGVEVTTGRHYITWVLSPGLEENRTPLIMREFRERINTTFYIRYIYAIKIWNIEDWNHYSLLHE